MLYTKHLN